MLTLIEQEHLKELEYSLWKDDTRFNTTYMERILHQEFFEFGRSGRVYERKNTIYTPRSHIDAIFPFSDFSFHEVTKDIILITYKSQVQYETLEIGNRSSLWIRTNDGWKLRFHQGTPTT